ncbi:S9 family peptidase [Phenylobacterium soli]|uniref:S9 family peptidase n=1 Tax=Phenylobacterium soli TaxID=2170551 RepID=A0A328AGW3_9CAUL|nr:S9 family peptidase [Phenylobacterium soli]RAK53879.1 S9 family peptidase [Phenylobacterium soli]
MRRLLIACAIAAVATAASAAPPAKPAAPLIARTKLFGNPSRSAGRVSPDGKWISWLAPRDGVMNVWVAPVADPAAARPLTAEKVRPIRAYFWSPDSAMVLFVNDKGGDENFLLYGVDLARGAQKTLTPFEKTRAQVVGISRLVKDRILVGINNRDPRWHDVYSLDLKTGALTPVFHNDGFADFGVDAQLNLRTAMKPRPDGGADIYRIENNQVAASPETTIPFEDTGGTAPISYSHDGKTRYWLESRGRDTSALVAEDLATGQRTVLGQDPRADMGEVLDDPKTGRIQAYGVEYLKTEWTALDPAIKPDLEFLKRELKGELTITSRSDDDRLWMVAADSVTAPVTYYLYDRPAKRLKRLFTTRPELEGAPLVDEHPVEIRTRDGLTEVSYLTLPPGSDPKGRGRPSHPVPMVLLVHGGPWARDSYGSNNLAQWLANRGYAVLQPNYRASSGFGKKYLTAGDLQWGRKMHDDLLDAVNWAVTSGVTTPDKVAIMGGSYGGYATLAGLAFTPTTFACGVDIVGPSNLNTLLAAIPAYWEAGRRQMYRRMGDPGTPEGQAILKAASPLFKADAIQRPLLIGQGANDPRVNVRESQQIVDAMKAKGLPVTYVLFPDEGHGFARPENNIAFFATAEHFLERCLGGRSEPFGAAFAGSSITAPYGAQFAPGLKEALQAAGKPAP